MSDHPIDQELTIRRRHLPHWQLGGSVYFITFRSARGSLPDIALRQVMANIRYDHGRRYDLHFAVVMPDHAHLLLQPREKGPGQWFDLAEIMKGIKGVSSRRINQLLGTSGTVWQAESYDRIIRNEEEYRQKWEYMWNNPVKAGLVSQPEQYAYFVFPEDRAGKSACPTVPNNAVGQTLLSADEATGAGKSACPTPKPPEVILGLKVCDPACGSASFLVAALHYLTEALYKSLCHHCKLDDPAQAKKLTLPYGRPRTGKVDEELVPFPPNDPQRGHTFEDRVKALLRRHVVERCLYGVDINPLAVEFARVSLWVETLDPELPFSFLDHKIKVGNSLVGCWLDRVLDYPLKAWEREGGDGKKGTRTQRIETLLKGELQGNRRSGDGPIKREMRDLVERRFSQQPHLFADDSITTTSVADQARAEYEKLHELPVGDPDERERYYREHIQESPPLCALKAAMDEWCAVWFWPTDEASLRHAPTPYNLYAGEELSADTIIAVPGQVRFFHWELEFPDVFTPARRGFDAMIGNPPWDVMKPNSQEFFTDFDPHYRLYDKQEALHQQAKLFAAIPGLKDQWDEYNARFKALANWVGKITDPFDLALARGKEGAALQSAWARHRQKRLGFADAHHPFRLQGSADLNSYKLFAEFFWNLLQPDGRLGVILPTGIYSDFGTRALREEFLFRGRLEFLYAFQNEKKICNRSPFRQQFGTRLV